MNSRLAGFGLLLSSALPGFADHLDCAPGDCPLSVEIRSTAEDASYGLLLKAPAAGCSRIRYRVETPLHLLLGKSPVLHPGEIAVVRLGRGFSQGLHRLLVRSDGCASAPVHARRVTLRKPAPDHSWRATLIDAAAKTAR